MNTSSIKNFDELPLFLNAQLVSRALGISPSSAYELLHEDGFPSLRIGSRLVVPKEQFRLWVERQTGGAHWEPSVHAPAHSVLHPAVLRAKACKAGRGMRAGTHPKAVGSVPTGAAGKRPSTRVSRVSRLCPIFRAQPGAYPPETQNRTSRQRAAQKFDQNPAQRVRPKEEMRRTWETPKRAKSDDFGRCGEKAG